MGPRDCCCIMPRLPSPMHPACFQGSWSKHARSRTFPCKLQAQCSGTHAPSASDAGEYPHERRGIASTAHDEGLNLTTYTLGNPSQLRLENIVTEWSLRTREHGDCQSTHQHRSPCLMPTEKKKRRQKEEIGRKKMRKVKGGKREQPQASMQAQFSHSVPPPPYLRVPKATDVWIKVKEDSLERPRKGDSPDQQNNQHEVWKCRREIHHLRGG